MDLFKEVDIYSMNIEIASHANINILIFSDPITSEFDLKEFYYDKYHLVQQDLNKYSFKYVGRFDSDSEYFDLACEGLKYSTDFS